MVYPGIWVANGIPTDVNLMYSWSPGTVVCFVDYLKANQVWEYKLRRPEAQVVIRFQHPMNWAIDRRQAAINHANYVVSKWNEIKTLDPFVYFCNEMNLHYENGDPNPGNQHLYTTPDFYRRYAEWVTICATEIKNRVPDMRLVCPPFAYGHREDGAPDDSGNPKEGWAGYDYLAGTIRTLFDNTICGHYYWGDAGGCIPARLYDPVESSWHAFRWRRLLRMFRVRYGISAKMLIDECGNFQTWHPDFTGQCEYYARECLSDPRVIGLAFFLWEDPTRSPGNEPNSWQYVKDLRAHVSAMGKLDIQSALTIRVRKMDNSIETMPVEEYLRGVVPAEVFPSWHMDALKAQAVLARSVAMARIERPRGSTFDISETDQVYRPARVHTRTDQAVKETAGVFLVENGKPYYASYVSSCGRKDCPNCKGEPGHKTENNPSGLWPGRACQWGLQEMAKSGKPWQEIATYYYSRSVTLKEDSMVPIAPVDPKVIDASAMRNTWNDQGLVTGAVGRVIAADVVWQRWAAPGTVRSPIVPGTKYMKVIHIACIPERPGGATPQNICVEFRDLNGQRKTVQDFFLAWPSSRLAAEHWTVQMFDGVNTGAYPGGYGEVPMGRNSFLNVQNGSETLGPYILGAHNIPTEYAILAGLINNRHHGMLVIFQEMIWQPGVSDKPDVTTPGCNLGSLLVAIGRAMGGA
jgi:hypothetical protein